MIDSQYLYDLAKGTLIFAGKRKSLPIIYIQGIDFLPLIQG